MSLTSLMPAVAAHCLAYSKVVSGAKLRMLRALLETMRSIPAKRNPTLFCKNLKDSGRLEGRIHMRSEEPDTHACRAAVCYPSR